MFTEKFNIIGWYGKVVVGIISNDDLLEWLVDVEFVVGLTDDDQLK